MKLFADRPTPTAAAQLAFSSLGGSLLLGMLLAALAAAFAVRPQRLRSDLAVVGFLVRSTQLEARAPPHLQPA